jgi:hypothetical protein
VQVTPLLVPELVHEQIAAPVGLWGELGRKGTGEGFATNTAPATATVAVAGMPRYTRLPAEIWFWRACAVAVVVPAGRVTVTVEPEDCLSERRLLHDAPHPLLVEPVTPAAVLMPAVARASVVELHEARHQLTEMLVAGAPGAFDGDGVTG